MLYENWAIVAVISPFKILVAASGVASKPTTTTSFISASLRACIAPKPILSFEANIALMLGFFKMIDSVTDLPFAVSHSAVWVATIFKPQFLNPLIAPSLLSKAVDWDSIPVKIATSEPFGVLSQINFAASSAPFILFVPMKVTPSFIPFVSTNTTGTPLLIASSTIGANAFGSPGARAKASTPLASWSSTWLICACTSPSWGGATNINLTPNFLASSSAPFVTEAQKGFPDPGPLILNKIFFPWPSAKDAEIMLIDKKIAETKTTIFLDSSLINFPFNNY